MIEICLKNRSMNDYVVVMPYEINNEFLGEASRRSLLGEISGVDFIQSFNDFGTLEFSVKELDKLHSDFIILEKKLEEITKKVPLPKMVGLFDGVLHVGYKTPLGFDNFVELGTGGGKYFDKKDMLYLIGLVKEKILEAKEKGDSIIFSGD